jgi:hypothetical protein
VFFWFRRSVWIPIQEARTGIPKRTLIVQEGERRSTFWTEAHRGGPGGEPRGEPGVHVEIALHLTNVTKRRVQVSKVELHFRQGVFGAVREGDIRIMHSDLDVYGHYPVLPDQMAVAQATWLIFPPFQKANHPTAVLVCVIDQFGNRCWSDKIRLFYIGDARRMF